MSLTSFGYFVFLFVLLIVYYSFGRRYQNVVLLISSIFFYASFINDYLYLFLPLIEVAIVYEGAILIERFTDNKKFVLIITIGILVLILFVFKYAFNVFSLFGNAQKFESFFSFVDLIPVIGISYYTLSAIGYLLEVYWGNLKADKNLIDAALFVLFFPQLISGPITRFRQMKDQFHVQHKLDYENLTNGMRRMLWGYFKKMVISDRFAVIVKEVFRNYTDYNCFGIVLAVASYMIQLYTDFSGCMDMVIGTAQLFGISLPENFDAPFLSSSYREFWQRWHITLGGWFKDYVMYPLQLSKWINRLAKKIKNKFGKNAGKKIPVYIAMAVVWLLLGIWHGGTPCYMLSTGIMPCLFLIM
ncbi:MAG: MBOAT family protein [Erysipelotrichaceae bacterium]|nr:MBOAT family protein [Erysipelotrichaceae bacterium]